MATATELTLTESMTPGPTLFDVRRRITVEEFHRMIDAGVFGDEPRLELIEGVIVEKMGKKEPHIIGTDLVQYLFIRFVPEGYSFSMANPLTIEERDSEPEPDAMVFKGLPRDLLRRPRTPRDATLVVEVSDTSYAFDRKRKLAVYADAGVPVYWVLDLNGRRLEVFEGPIGEGAEASYRNPRVYLESDEAPLVLDGVEVARFAVGDILP